MAGDVSLTGLTSDDIVATGGFLCQILALEPDFYNWRPALYHPA